MAKGKYEKTIELSTHIIRLDVVYGSLRWKVTDLAKFSRQSRSRIYELMGRNKAEMRLQALHFLLEDLYGLAPGRDGRAQAGGKFQCFLHGRSLVLGRPELLSFYFRNRELRNDIGEVIRNYEKRFLASLAQDSRIRDSVSLLFVRTMIHGLSMAPFLDEVEVRAVMQKLSDLVRTGF